jgi:hypothetical protein
VSLRNIFEFISSDIRPTDALIAFIFEDDYSFGILQSKLHWEWWKSKCSTLGETFRYTINPVWDTFPWTQNPTKKQIENVAFAAKKLRDKRNEIINKSELTLREIYQLMEKGGKFPLRDLHDKLDNAVIEAYGFDKNKDILEQLLNLNLELAEKEKNNIKIQVPGVPDYYTEIEKIMSDDCVKFET